MDVSTLNPIASLPKHGNHQKVCVSVQQNNTKSCLYSPNHRNYTTHLLLSGWNS